MRAAVGVEAHRHLPVGIFKSNPPLALVGPDRITPDLASTATTAHSPNDAHRVNDATTIAIEIVRSAPSAGASF